MFQEFPWEYLYWRQLNYYSDIVVKWCKTDETLSLQKRPRWGQHNRYIYESHTVTKISINPISREHCVHHFILLIAGSLEYVALKNSYLFLVTEVQTSDRLKNSSRKKVNLMQTVCLNGEEKKKKVKTTSTWQESFW